MSRTSTGSILKSLRLVAGIAVSTIAVVATFAVAQPAPKSPVNTTPSRQTLEEAASQTCEGVSVIVQRCAKAPDDAAPNKTDDASTRSRAATKAAFDRRDQRARDAALQGTSVPPSTPIGDAQRLDTVTVTGKDAVAPPNVEEILQRALAQPGVAPNGTVSHYALDGTRYDCIAKCIGPMCCAAVRSMPNPARDSITIGR